MSRNPTWNDIFKYSIIILYIHHSFCNHQHFCQKEISAFSLGVDNLALATPATFPSSLCAGRQLARMSPILLGLLVAIAQADASAAGAAATSVTPPPPTAALCAPTKARDGPFVVVACSGRGLGVMPPLPQMVRAIVLSHNSIRSLVPDHGAVARGRRDWTSPCDQQRYPDASSAGAAGSERCTPYPFCFQSLLAGPARPVAVRQRVCVPRGAWPFSGSTVTSSAASPLPSPARPAAPFLLFPSPP